MTTRQLTSSGLMGFAGEQTVRNWRLLVRLTSLPMLIVILQGVLMRVFAPEAPLDQTNAAEVEAGVAAATQGISTIAVVSAVAAHLAVIPACTAWHRLALTGSADRGDGSTYGWDRREWLQLMIYLAIFGTIFLLSIAFMLITSFISHPAAIAFCAIVAFALGTICWAAFGLALPATALGLPFSLGAYLRLPKIDLVRIAASMIGVSLICMMIGIAVVLVVGLPLLTFFHLNLVFEILAFTSYLSLVVSVAVWSRAYDELFSPRPRV